MHGGRGMLLRNPHDPHNVGHIKQRGIIIQIFYNGHWHKTNKAARHRDSLYLAVTATGQVVVCSRPCLKTLSSIVLLPQKQGCTLRFS